MISGREREVSLGLPHSEGITSGPGVSHLRFPTCGVGYKHHLVHMGVARKTALTEHPRQTFLRQVLQAATLVPSFHACSKIGFQGCIWNKVWPSDLLWSMKCQKWHVSPSKRNSGNQSLVPYSSTPEARVEWNPGGLGWEGQSSLRRPVLGAADIWHSLTVRHRYQRGDGHSC